MRKITAVLLVFCLFSGMGIFVQAETEKPFLEQVEVSPSEIFGIPFAEGNPQILKVAATVQDGIPVAVTVTSGDPAALNIVNLETGELIDSISLEVKSSSWIIQTDSKGKVYLGVYNNPCYFYCYDPSVKQLIRLGLIPGSSALISMDFDQEDNPILGTFPNGTIVKYDVKTGTFLDYGSMKTAKDDSQNYIRGLAYHDGLIYYTFMNYPGVYCYNPDIPDKEEAVTQLPPLPNGYTQVSSEKLFIRGNYLVALLGMPSPDPEKTGPRHMFFYDLASKQWKNNVVEEISDQYITKEINGGFYYKSAKIMDGHALYFLKLSDFSVEKTKNTFGSSIRGTDFVEIKRPDMAGTCFVNALYDGIICIINFEKGKMVKYQGMLPGSPIEVRRIAFDDQNRLYATQYMGTRGIRWNLETGNSEYYHMGQADSMGQVGDQMIFGNYTGANIYQMDLNKPVNEIYNKNDPNINPKIIGSMGQSQDRVPLVKEADGLAMIGTIPDYEYVGGALTIYDPKTQKYDVYRNLIEDQSILGLCYEDGIIYGSSAVSCGLSASPTKDLAEVFQFDLKTRKLIKSAVPKLDQLKYPVGGIGDVTIGPDGLLWAATTGLVFAMDKDTLEVVKQIKLSESQPAPSTDPSRPHPYKQYWWPKSVLFGKNGHLFVSDGGKLRIIDPKTEQSRLTDVECGTCFVMDKDDQIYFYTGSKVKKAELSYSGFAREPKEIVINTSGSIGIPSGQNANTIKLEAVVKDQLGEPMQAEVSWTLKESKKGVNVINGQLTVTNEAEPGEITVIASVSGIAAEKKITLAKETLSITISAEDSVTIPLGQKTQDTILEAVIKNQAGETVQADVTWSLKENKMGVTITGNQLKVSNLAEAGAITVIASTGEYSSEKEITVIEPKFTLTVSGSTSAAIPTGSSVKKITLNAVVKGPDGKLITDAAVNWNLTGSYAGVLIDGNVVSVTSSASSGTAGIEVSVRNTVATHFINLTKNTGGGGGGSYIPPVTPTPTPIPTPTPTPEPSDEPEMFKDLSADHWAYGSVKAMTDSGVLNGYEDGSFRPDATIKREEFVKVVVEAFGLKLEDAELNFSDVAKDEWSYPYICAAVSSGIVRGINEFSFGIGQEVTREDAAVMLERLLSQSQIDLPDIQEKINFIDTDQISEYAKDAVELMQVSGIIGGNPDGSFAPKMQATRAEICVMVDKILKRIK